MVLFGNNYQEFSIDLLPDFGNLKVLWAMVFNAILS